MKVLWITNVELPDISSYFNRESFFGGWLAQSSKLLCHQKEIELHVLSKAYQKYEETKINGIYFSSFVEDESDNVISKLIDMISPDIIHIWGTEFNHSLLAIEAVQKRNLLSKTVLSIQGLISYISRYHYYCFLPERIIKKVTLSGIKNFTTIEKERKEMLKKSECEKKALQICQNCIGRTKWDYLGIKLINNSINYYKCNEIMRESFYKFEWSYQKCEHYSVFFSQANYPLKGFHIMLEAASYIKKKYPNFKIRVLGKTIENSFLSYIHDNAYQRYLRELICKYDLWGNIKWLGNLNEEEMTGEFLSANVFVCSSSIENSSNSVSEAMLLGVPIVASDVGGIRSLLEDEKEGLLYQSDAPYLLAEKIEWLFENVNEAEEFGKNARKRALIDHDPFANTKRLLDIYSSLLKN